MDTKSSNLKRAKTFLALEAPKAYTPDRVIEVLGLRITGSTLARKFRAAATGYQPELVRSYYHNLGGEEIAQYAYNPEYLARMAHEKRVDQAENAREAAWEGPDAPDTLFPLPDGLK